MASLAPMWMAMALDWFWRSRRSRCTNCFISVTFISWNFRSTKQKLDRSLKTICRLHLPWLSLVELGAAWRFRWGRWISWRNVWSGCSRTSYPWSRSASSRSWVCRSRRSLNQNLLLHIWNKFNHCFTWIVSKAFLQNPNKYYFLDTLTLLRRPRPTGLRRWPVRGGRRRSRHHGPRWTRCRFRIWTNREPVEGTHQ